MKTWLKVNALSFVATFYTICMNNIDGVYGRIDRLHLWTVYTIVALDASPITLVIIMLYASIHVCVCVGGGGGH